MTHIAMQEALDGVFSTWMEHVTDEEYNGQGRLRRCCSTMESPALERAFLSLGLAACTYSPRAIRTTQRRSSRSCHPRARCGATGRRTPSGRRRAASSRPFPRSRTACRDARRTARRDAASADSASRMRPVIIRSASPLAISSKILVLSPKTRISAAFTLARANRSLVPPGLTMTRGAGPGRSRRACRTCPGRRNARSASCPRA